MEFPNAVRNGGIATRHKRSNLVPDMIRHGTDTGATTAVTKTGSKCTHEQLLGHIVTPV